MTDTPNTNPDANTTLVLCINTPSGPRSIVTNTLRQQDASLIADALQAAGHYAEVRPMGAVYSMAYHMKKHKAAMERRAKPALSGSNVTMLPSVRRK